LKSLLTISIFLITVFQTLAQELPVDSLNQTINKSSIQTLKDSINIQESNTDIINKAAAKSDSLNTQFLHNQYTSQTDSTIQTLQTTVNDTLNQGTQLVNTVTDSLESWQKLKVLEQWKANVLDSLKLMDLPKKLKDQVDSLANLPNLEAKLKERLSKLDGGPADSLQQKYLSAAEEVIGEEHKELGNSLLPESFNKTLQQYQNGGEGGNKIDEIGSFINEKEGAFRELKTDIDINQWVNADMNFLQDLQVNPDKIGSSMNNYSASISEYTSGAHEYVDLSSLNKELGGASDLNIDEALGDLDQEEYQKLVEEYGSLSDEALDQRIEQQLTQEMDEIAELQQYNASVDQVKQDHFGEGMEQVEQYRSIQDRIAEKKESLLANDVAMENMELINKAEKESQKLLEKYVNVDNSAKFNNASTDPEHKVRFGERLIFGSNLQLNPGSVISLDISPLLAYKINKRFISGIGGTFRYDFNKEDDFKMNFNDREPEFGYRTFVQYKAIGSFFIHGEWERMSVYNESRQKQWHNNYLAGIGRDLSIKKKLVVTVAVLYNFNHKNNPTYDSPFMVRFGLRKK